MSKTVLTVVGVAAAIAALGFAAKPFSDAWATGFWISALVEKTAEALKHHLESG
jgi:hypothetical protein